jgi:DNA-binding CsgD family transcriptional regulator
MGVRELQRGIEALADSVGRAESPEDLLARASCSVRRIVPFDGSAWFGTDPDTLLATLPVRIENVDQRHCETFWDRESKVADVLLFRDLARSPLGAGSLFEATAETPARSARHREFLAPQGYGDELRAVLRTGSKTWGVVCLMRNDGRGPFNEREVDVLRYVGPVIATELRRFAVQVVVEPASDLDVPGTALYDAEGRLLSLDAQAKHWLTELAGPTWPVRPLETAAISAVVSRAPMIADGQERVPASARLRAPSGRWMYVQASCLSTPEGNSSLIAVTIGPAKSSQIAPIIVEAYGLTPREREVTQAVARGLANQEIASALHLSTYTVRDHLKSVFGKVGVTTRGELIAKLFAEHYVPEVYKFGVERVRFEV